VTETSLLSCDTTGFESNALPLSSIAISATVQTCQGTEGAGEDTFRLHDDTPGIIETCDTGPLSPPGLLSIGFDDEADVNTQAQHPVIHRLGSTSLKLGMRVNNFRISIREVF
jgi:hypothetical protein